MERALQRCNHCLLLVTSCFGKTVLNVLGPVCDEFPFSEKKKLFCFTHRLGVFLCLVSLQLAGFQTFICQFLTPKDAFGSNFVDCFYEAKINVNFLEDLGGLEGGER